MRFEGTLTRWDDERGFGFIEPRQGGEPIFVHIRAFPAGSRRPAVAQPLTFEVEAGPKGKRARRVQWLEVRAPARPRVLNERQAAAQWGTATLFVLPAFAVLWLVLGMLWRPPAWFVLVYLGASALAFATYATDKAAARRRAWRVPESTLHLQALACGWPGALLAQQLLRHKSTKPAFRRTFWGTAALNTAALVALCSPLGRPLWAGL